MVEIRSHQEAYYTGLRAGQLEYRPIKGNFDADHLRAINRYIFQDLPGVGYHDVTPGEYRPPVNPGGDWVKNRSLEGRVERHQVFYSHMDDKAIDRLNKALEGANPAALSKLATGEFTDRIAKLYSELDAVHPFPDGNSRTLRVFTKQLARESGYELNWDHFGERTDGRNKLYVARDLSVNKINESVVRTDAAKRGIYETEVMLGQNRDLPGLMRDAGKDLIQPFRAVAFRELSPSAALAKHPELHGAVRTMDDAAKYSVLKFPGHRDQQEEFQKNVRTSIQKRLDAGELIAAPSKEQGRVRDESGVKYAAPSKQPGPQER